jgi:Uma2 family endonuclease
MTFLAYMLFTIARPLGFEVFLELRIRTGVDRFRVPDVCLMRGIPIETIPTEPPYLCIEILSPDDYAVDLRAKIREYLACGVEVVWIIDPVELTGEIHTQGAIERVTDGIFRAGSIQVDVRAMPRRT